MQFVLRMVRFGIQDIVEILHMLHIQQKEEHYRPIHLSNI